MRAGFQEDAVVPQRVGVGCEAQPGEHDLAAQGRTMEAAVDTLVRLIQAHVAYDRRHNRRPLSAFAAAPRAYWSAFNRAAELPIQMELDWQDAEMPARIVAAMVPDHPALRPFVARIA